MTLRHLAATIVLLATLPASASAADRFASPTGSGVACTAQAPCSIQTVFATEATGDDITLLPGTYGSPASPLSASLDVSGAAGVDVHTETPGVPVTIYSNVVDPVFFSSAGGQISDLRIRQTSTLNYRAFYVGSSAVATRIDARNGGAAGSTACQVQGSAQLADSLCVGTGTFTNALSVSGTLNGPNSPTIRNVTASTTGSPSGNDDFGNAIAVLSASGRAANVTLVNVIADGATHDIRVVKNADDAFVFTRNSLYDDPSTGGGGLLFGIGGNVIGSPTYQAGTFIPSAGSAAIDRGLDPDAPSRLDLAGNARRIGARTDIGAYERTIAPGATTAPADAITTTGAGLHGAVDPAGSATTYRFEYGVTTAYGNTTPERALGATDAARDVTEAIAGLTPGTTYHARLVATNATGTTQGADVTFTTAALPAATPATPAMTATPAPTPSATKGCTVPKVKAGSTVAQAKAALKRSGCAVGRTTKARSRTVRRGRVIRLGVRAGTTTTKAVTVTISRGRR